MNLFKNKRTLRVRGGPQGSVSRLLVVEQKPGGEEIPAKLHQMRQLFMFSVTISMTISITMTISMSVAFIIVKNLVIPFSI